MKKIIWASGISVALLGAVAVTTLTASAAVDDPTFIRRGSADNIKLNGTQKGAFATWSITVWPGITPADFSGLHCIQKPGQIGDVIEAKCIGYETVTYNAADYVVAEAAGEIEGNCTVISNDEIECKKPALEATLTQSQFDGLDDCIQGVWPGYGDGMLWELNLFKNDGVYGWLHYHSTASPNDYLDLISQGLIVKRTGTVAE